MLAAALFKKLFDRRQQDVLEHFDSSQLLKEIQQLKEIAQQQHRVLLEIDLSNPDNSSMPWTYAVKNVIDVYEQYLEVTQLAFRRKEDYANQDPAI